MQRISNRQINEYLHGKRQIAVAVQVFVLVAEWLLWGLVWLFPAKATVRLGTALLLDLLLLSPLRAGCALFFETLIADREAAQWLLLFRYYRHSYEKALGWRALVWCHRLLYNALFQLPALVLLSIGRTLAERATASDALWGMTCSILGGLLVIAATVGTEILLLRWQALPYLLSYRGRLRDAVSLARRATRRHTTELILPVIHHGIGVLAILLSLPLPYASARYRIEQAAIIRRLVTQIPQENVMYDLQRQKNCGKMDR